MASTVRPKVLKGAFVEYGLSIPPLIVPFQFNPVQLTRNRSLSYDFPGSPGTSSDDQAAAALTKTGKKKKQIKKRSTLRDYHKRFSTLEELQKKQIVTIEEESISLEIRFDATGKLNEGDALAQQFGIGPQLSALESLTLPKEEGILGQAVSGLFGESKGFSFTAIPKPPMVLFIWGITRVMPVNINSINITETEFNTWLIPIRATVSVSLTVIEGPNGPYSYTKVMKEVMTAINLANLADVTDIIIPG